MKADYRYRIYPNEVQKVKLNQLFGCCRYVGNNALSHCNQQLANQQKKTSNYDLQKQFITLAKKELVMSTHLESIQLRLF